MSYRLVGVVALCAVSFACGNRSRVVAMVSSPATDQTPTVTSLSLHGPSAWVDGMFAVHARARMSDGSVRNVSEETQWTGSPPAVDPIGNGVFVTKSEGRFYVTGTYREKSARFLVIVKHAPSAR